MAARINVENPSPLQPRNFPFRLLPFPFLALQQAAGLSPVEATGADPEPQLIAPEEGRFE